MREAADYYLSLPETDRRRVNAMLRDQIDPEDVDNQMAVVVGITEQAKRGNPQAASVLLKMLGEEAVQEDPARTIEDDPITKSLKEEFKK